MLSCRMQGNSKLAIEFVDGREHVFVVFVVSVHVFCVEMCDDTYYCAVGSDVFEDKVALIIGRVRMQADIHGQKPVLNDPAVLDGVLVQCGYQSTNLLVSEIFHGHEHRAGIELHVGVKFVYTYVVIGYFERNAGTELGLDPVQSIELLSRNG